MPTEELFVDTNIIVRLLTRDDPAMAERAYQAFQQVEAGEFTVTTTDAVIAEVVYVLSSKRLYNLPRGDINAKLATLLALKGFRLPRKRVTLRALDLYASTTLDFVDTLIAAAAEHSKSKKVLSFDTDFDAIEGITRRAP